MMKALRAVVIAGLGSAMMSAAPAAAQDQTNPYLQTIISQFAAIVPHMAEAGYPNYEVLTVSEIAAGANETLNYTTQDGQDVVFVGVCDQDCTDLDLRVRGANGVIGEDVATDDKPLVPTPAGARPLAVNAIMTACSTATCVYGVAVFRR